MDLLINDWKKVNVVDGGVLSDSQLQDVMELALTREDMFTSLTSKVLLHTCTLSSSSLHCIVLFTSYIFPLYFHHIPHVPLRFDQ